MYARGDGIASIIKIFQGAKAERLSYEDNWEMSYEDIANFAEFLKSQPTLTDINMTSNVSSKLFANRDFASSAPFKLESFFVWINGNGPDGFVAGPQVYKGISHFIKMQKSSLRTLTLARCNIPARMVRKVIELDLKDVRFVDAKFDGEVDLSGVENHSIEHAFISLHEEMDEPTDMGLSRVFKSCKNLKKIRFSCVEIAFEMSVAMAFDMPNLQTLSFFRCELKPIYYSSLKNLKIRDCDVEEVTRLVRVNRHLETLHVPSSFRFDDDFVRGVDETAVKSIEWF